ncbi:hypothetical protein CONCODRAFT_14620 [Conidiobolus coronatus NRRL 28638]|uniref:Uncharacterized protein n=1 Tax=Conidiobolus coronatus (strain ATCC 28846 / CBS 209.66 / NRRL 28638) TaxID=796925 RepID=A0A137PI26_CONC2|nr:hypothetical protein CONCODRAFT_14620 [Conidiobolus coronatus NRRL 28638]|eukprot:KXN74652.1 hypothetical protein CONCODRAFT_14620 [Conidiobolus coronatus NRRL 28638]
MPYNQWNLSNKSKVPVNLHSCLQCFMSKKKCDRATVCGRCAARNENCNYYWFYYSQNTQHRRSLTFKCHQVESTLNNLIQNINRLNLKYTDHSLISTQLDFENFNKYKQSVLYIYFQVFNRLSNASVLSMPYGVAYELIQIFDRYIHPISPFLDMSKIYSQYRSSSQCSPLLAAIFCRSEYFCLSEFTNKRPPKLQDQYFYRYACHLIEQKFSEFSLEFVQSCLVLVSVELSCLLTVKALSHMSHAVKKSYIMNLHNPSDPMRQLEDPATKQEKEATWHRCVALNNALSFHFNIPHFIVIDYSTPLGPLYSKDPSTLTRTEALKVSARWTQYFFALIKRYSWPFPKPPLEQTPQLFSILQFNIYTLPCHLNLNYLINNSPTTCDQYFCLYYLFLSNQVICIQLLVSLISPIEDAVAQNPEDHNLADKLTQIKQIELQVFTNLIQGLKIIQHSHIEQFERIELSDHMFGMFYFYAAKCTLIHPQLRCRQNFDYFHDKLQSLSLVWPILNDMLTLLKRLLIRYPL